jgi:hypothetical protein
MIYNRKHRLSGKEVEDEVDLKSYQEAYDSVDKVFNGDEHSVVFSEDILADGRMKLTIIGKDRLIYYQLTSSEPITEKIKKNFSGTKKGVLPLRLPKEQKDDKGRDNTGK